MKTIFLSSFHSLISRNILQTDVLPSLLKRGVRVVLLVPEKKKEYFRKAFGSEYVVVEGVAVPKKRFEGVFQFFSLSLVSVESLFVRDWKTNGKYFRYYGAHALYRMCAPFFIFHRFFRFIARLYFRTDAFASLFNAYKPDLIVATDSFGVEDRILLLEAQRNGVKTIGMIRSWDNATTRGVFLPDPDHILAPIDVIKEEMSEIHHISGDSISVVGIPHYDKVNVQRKISREEFLRKIGLDPRKKTILYSPGGKILYAHDDKVLAFFQNQLNADRFHQPVQFLISIQPGDTIDVSGIEKDARFAVYRFGTDVTGRRKENEMSQNENEYLNDFFVHCDVLVTLASTMAIDGTVFGKPVVVFGFDPEEGLSDKMEKFARYRHLKIFFETGLVTISHSRDEFIKQINAFLIDPDLNKDKREALIARYAYRLDGKSGERVAERIFKDLAL